MVKLLKLVCFFTLCWADNYGSTSFHSEYYWKEYFNGAVPSDAIPGGHSKNGSATYVGLIVHPQGKGLIPATIYPGEYAIAQVSFQGKTSPSFVYQKNIQILCSRHHSCYNWVKIHTDGFYKVPGSVVRAGNEWDFDTYVGRGQYNDELSIGRVYRPETAHRGLWLTGREKGEYKHLQEFEVLVFSSECKMCKLDIDTSRNWLIDVRST